MSISRRSVVIGLGAGTLVTGSSGAAQLLMPTPQETFGPFFPVHTPPHPGSDLTRVPGRPGRATGQIIEISGPLEPHEPGVLRFGWDIVMLQA